MDEVTPDFDDSEDYSLFYTAKLGEDARAFLATDVGKFLLGCAKQEIEAASNSLLTVAPWRKRKITQLQNKAETAKNFLIWINEAISMGENAHQQLLMKKRG